MLVDRVLREFIDARRTLGVSQRTVATALGIDHSQYWRIEARQVRELTLERICEIASLLGFDVSLGLHPNGDPIRDGGQQALGKRFDALLGPGWNVTDEALLPNPGDRRSWDKLLRLRGAEPRHVVGADLESRIHDIQALGAAHARTGARRRRRRDPDRAQRQRAQQAVVRSARRSTRPTIRNSAGQHSQGPPARRAAPGIRRDSGLKSGRERELLFGFVLVCPGRAALRARLLVSAG
jgi:transcriptional regulator with XRE-family HTH domain